MLKTYSWPFHERQILIYKEHNLLIVEGWEGNNLIYTWKFFYKKDKEDFLNFLEKLEKVYDEVDIVDNLPQEAHDACLI